MAIGQNFYVVDVTNTGFIDITPGSLTKTQWDEKVSTLAGDYSAMIDTVVDNEGNVTRVEFWERGAELNNGTASVRELVDLLEFVKPYTARINHPFGILVGEKFFDTIDDAEAALENEGMWVMSVDMIDVFHVAGEGLRIEWCED